VATDHRRRTPEELNAMSTLRKIKVEEAIRDAFLPLTVDVKFPDRYFDPTDRVGFTVFDLESEVLHQEPYRTCLLADAEAWIEAARRKVISLGYQLDEWRKPAWMSEVLRPGDEIDEEDKEG
jgi:hypothetical protein